MRTMMAAQLFVACSALGVVRSNLNMAMVCMVNATDLRSPALNGTVLVAEEERHECG